MNEHIKFHLEKSLKTYILQLFYSTQNYCSEFIFYTSEGLGGSSQTKKKTINKLCRWLGTGEKLGKVMTGLRKMFKTMTKI